LRSCKLVKIFIDVIEGMKNKRIISKHIYGHFSEHLGRCIYDGFWVGENSKIPNTRGIRDDIVRALKKISIPNLRWPGGCFADEYHWKDGIGPKDKRPKTINTHWGGVIENNEFGTHEFFDLCEQLNCEPYISGNVGSGTVREMAEWIEYITYEGESTLSSLRRSNGKTIPWKIKYWGVGNENWGCGGNMTAKHYADLFCNYSTYCKNLSGNKLYKIACGPVGEYPLEWVLNWIEVILDRIKLSYDKLLDGISLHYYTRAGFGASATKFNEKKWFLTMQKALYMETLITEISKMMEKYDPSNKYGLIIDEWGTWWRVEKDTNPSFLYQQNTMRDALVASLHLDIFNNHCERVHMANIAQTLNVLQALILTKEDKMIVTPTYHVFDMYKVHQGAYLLPINIISNEYTFKKENIAAIHGSVSKDEEGNVNVSLSNIDPNNSVDIKMELNGQTFDEVNAQILRGNEVNSYNDFDSPENVNPKNFHITNFQSEKNQISFTMPSMSIMVINIS
jgi:alpha-L-arabinofuranosidase